MQPSALCFLLSSWPEESEWIPVWTGVSFRKPYRIKPMHRYRESTITAVKSPNSFPPLNNGRCDLVCSNLHSEITAGEGREHSGWQIPDHKASSYFSFPSLCSSCVATVVPWAFFIVRLSSHCCHLLWFMDTIVTVVVNKHQRRGCVFSLALLFAHPRISFFYFGHSMALRVHLSLPMSCLQNRCFSQYLFPG